MAEWKNEWLKELTKEQLIRLAVELKGKIASDRGLDEGALVVLSFVDKILKSDFDDANRKYLQYLQRFESIDNMDMLALRKGVKLEHKLNSAKSIFRKFRERYFSAFDDYEALLDDCESALEE